MILHHRYIQAESNIDNVGRRYIVLERLWYVVFFVLVTYNSHRYILKYGHSEFIGSREYTPTPLIWQLGKYFIIGLLLILVYINSRFKVSINRPLLIFYSFVLVVFFINLTSAIIYSDVSTDEFEYIVFAFLLFPVTIIYSEDLLPVKNNIHHFLFLTQLFLFLSNIYVIVNYFVLGVLPFHAYVGLLRFSGLWDDPNPFAILCIFLLGHSIHRKQYIMIIVGILSVIMTISFNGYLLLVLLFIYNVLHNRRFKVVGFFLFSFFTLLVCTVILLNWSLILDVYELKSGSIQDHTSLALVFYPLPLFQPIVFHETWWLSLNINYFPLSAGVTLYAFFTAFMFLFFKETNLQRLGFLIFVVTNLFLPFLYMFPINFMAILFFILYHKNIRF